MVIREKNKGKNMNSHDTKLPPSFQSVLERFIAACQADERIVAAFLGGSYARDAADQYSDLDLYVITTDEDFNEFCAQRGEFVNQLGEPIFKEDFGNTNIIFYILADGSEGEIEFGRESRFLDVHSGSYKVLLDKKRILEGAVFPERYPDAAEQTEKLRRQITWFWHDLSHFIKAMRRGQLWWAQGELEILRGCCVSLARLRNNFLDVNLGDEVSFKLEDAMPVELLSPLQTTYCSMDAEAMLEASLVIVRFYKALAVPLAEAHGLIYPDALERVLVPKLEELRHQT
jgi:predicted nucleotidyltransferase